MRGRSTSMEIVGPDHPSDLPGTHRVTRSFRKSRTPQCSYASDPSGSSTVIGHDCREGRAGTLPRPPLAADSCRAVGLAGSHRGDRPHSMDRNQTWGPRSPGRDVVWSPARVQSGAPNPKPQSGSRANLGVSVPTWSERIPVAVGYSQRPLNASSQWFSRSSLRQALPALRRRAEAFRNHPVRRRYSGTKMSENSQIERRARGDAVGRVLQQRRVLEAAAEGWRQGRNQGQRDDCGTRVFDRVFAARTTDRTLPSLTSRSRFTGEHAGGGSPRR